MVCTPSKWLWGLLPLAPVIALALYGVRGDIERDLTERATVTLKQQGLPWARASFQGRNAILEGLSFSRSERDSALKAIENVWGVRSVIDNSNLIASPETYTWWARRGEQRIKISGHVPTRDDRRTILGFARAAMPDMEVEDQMVLAGGSPPRQAWLGSVSFALLQLGQLKSGNISLSGTDLSVSGEALSSAAYQNLKNALSTQLPAGITLKADGVRPPVVKPFSLKVKYTGSIISLSGHVPSERLHVQVLERTRNLFPGIKIEDGLELASGAPEDWLWAVSASLTQLHRLESGRLRLKDTALEIEGVAPNEYTAKDVAASILNGLPSSYRPSEKVTVREKPSPGKPTSG